MKLSCLTLAYKEERFIRPFVQVMKPRVNEVLVLNSTKPWQGEDSDVDNTAMIARSLGATVIEHDWPTEHDQRNAGMEYLSDSDWIIVLDPDEYLLDKDWDNLVSFLETAEAPAYVTGMQYTYWKHGFVIDPPEDYKQLIAVRPGARFFDKRCIDVPYGFAPTELHHFSWARTDEECLSKISHYSHGHELNKSWYQDIWLADKRTNVHPLTPESLRSVVPVKLPEELNRLNLWP